eukprot:CAMPEP_0183299938 /NCGR_PEP_ID=MMETSP0160_2-20130417/6515_1 /TAXON_ID=2839 ORGANISM="Odontella Sinensis, Strain Grunow 1884" /NCGR_SAMPLE_ID=MMETSP0160_2 /ASSEMBLY_ACC=CAM_ASM_000250 /LENGTH=94 /DNA_ID=CAMNT_0025462263 /DNA_START=69 /DNA_END=353 /DNA_ORIENTATION=-
MHRAYPHPYGYFVHKSRDGTFFADIGTVSPLGEADRSAYPLEEYDAGSVADSEEELEAGTFPSHPEKEEEETSDSECSHSDGDSSEESRYDDEL